MLGEKEKAYKELLEKKSLLEIESMIMDHKKKMSMEKDLLTLSRLSTELSILHEVRDSKQRASGRMVSKGVKPAAKPELKSYDDYVKSKK